MIFYGQATLGLVNLLAILQEIFCYLGASAKSAPGEILFHIFTFSGRSARSNDLVKLIRSLPST